MGDFGQLKVGRRRAARQVLIGPGGALAGEQRSGPAQSPALVLVDCKSEFYAERGGCRGSGGYRFGRCCCCCCCCSSCCCRCCCCCSCCCCFSDSCSSCCCSCYGGGAGGMAGDGGGGAGQGQTGGMLGEHAQDGGAPQDGARRFGGARVSREQRVPATTTMRCVVRTCNANRRSRAG